MDAERKRYLVFIDECGDDDLSSVDPEFPVLVLAACVIEQQYYLASANPALDMLKYRFWGKRSINLHSAEIRRRKGPFAELAKNGLYFRFQDDLTSIMVDLDYTVIAAGIHKGDHIAQYVHPKPAYELLLEFLVERLHKLMWRLEASCEIIVESRGKKRDEQLEMAFSRLMESGTDFIGAISLAKTILGIRFLTKQDNESGLQIADLVAYPVARFILGSSYDPFRVVLGKMDRKDDGCIMGYGMTVFPNRTRERVRLLLDSMMRQS